MRRCSPTVPSFRCWVPAGRGTLSFRRSCTHVPAFRYHLRSSQSEDKGRRRRGYRNDVRNAGKAGHGSSAARVGRRLSLRAARFNQRCSGSACRPLSADVTRGIELISPSNQSLSTRVSKSASRYPARIIRRSAIRLAPTTWPPLT